jgi:hypothetical protein
VAIGDCNRQSRWNQTQSIESDCVAMAIAMESAI